MLKSDGSEVTTEELLHAWHEAEAILAAAPVGSPERPLALMRATKARDAYLARLEPLDAIALTPDLAAEA
jgi:hypothetical protein